MFWISPLASAGVFLKEVNMPSKGINPVQHSERSAGTKKDGKKTPEAKKKVTKKR